ncbi:MAG: NAD-dependent DNA ligase LigA [Clostridiales bacterium]|nr:NAD-dependent DNA ligase LigA [Candidatus Crickella caballi]
MDKKERIDILVEKLNEASKAYYDDASEIMTNFEYDEAYDELLALEAETGYVRDDSPSINVGYETKTALPKVTHEKKMLSLNKTKDREELRAWLGDNEGLLSWKLDGLTVVLTYENGRLARAVTRGNGTRGELITDNALACRNVPRVIPCKGKAIIRGEAVIKYSDFEKINEAIDDADAKYKNPRNLCSGSIRQLDPKVTAARSVNFYAFSLYALEDEDTKLEPRRSAQMEWMKEQGFDVVFYEKVNSDNLVEAIDRFEAKIPDFDIPSDGLVLMLDDEEYARSLGETAKFPRDAMAFKWRDQNAETVLREIEWSPSRTGLLNPVAIFDPVELEGTTVSRASVHNINIMEDLELGIGDTIVVYKANMIIPQISGNLTRSSRLDIPAVCPVCGGATEIRDEEGTRTLICLNPDCLAKHVKKFSLFVSRDAMNIEGLSEQGLLKFIGAGILRSLPDIFDLVQHREEIVSMEGFGAKSYDNLVASIDKARQTTPARLLYSLGVPGIGVTTSNVIARACRNEWSKIRSLRMEDLTSIDGVGDVMASDYIKYFSNDENGYIIDKVLERITLDESFEAAGSKLEGKTFVITGNLEHYANRKDLKAEIEAEGGKVAGSVSANTDYLITNDPGSGSAKNKAARELGVAIITEEEIRSMLM